VRQNPHPPVARYADFPDRGVLRSNAGIGDGRDMPDFVVIAGLAIYPGETGINDPQRAEKRRFHEGIRDVSR
jgi:hypothetical protein